MHIFGKFFFPHIIKGNSEVPECHVDLIRELSSESDSAIIFPRGFAKTTWEKIDTIHDVVYGLEPVILYIANILSDAQNHFESIKQELENNETLRDIFGNLVPPDYKLSHKWTNRHFETLNGVNVVARGAGKGRGVNIKNNRPSKIIFDDIEDDVQVSSAERRDKLHNWIYNVIFPSRDKERSRIKFIGTVISPLCEVLAFYKKHGGMFRKARENGHSIWPNYFSDLDLEEIKIKLGTRVFMQEYMNTPTDESLAIVPIKWIEPNFYTTIPKYEELQIIIMLDPQAGESKGADFYGLTVLGRFKNDRHRYLLERREGKATQMEQAGLFVKTYQSYHNVRQAGIEKVMAQVAVYQLVLEWQQGKIDLKGVNNHNRNISVIPVTPEGKDKVARFQMHQAAFERGEIHLHMTERAFAEKLTCFPNVDHDDDIDAFIYCLEWANRMTDFSQTLTSAEDVYVPPPLTASLRSVFF